MDYISAKEAARNWGVHIRVVQAHCKSGRISGAKKYGVAWMIPADSLKPSDQRRARDCSPPAEQRHDALPRQCPQIIATTLYNTPGSGDRLVADLADTPTVQALFAAQLAYLRGQINQAVSLASRLLKTADDSNVRAGCCFTLCLCAMYTGNAAAWSEFYTMLSELPCNTRGERAERDFMLANTDSSLYDGHSYPDWLRKGDFSPLPLDCYPLARILYLRYFILGSSEPGATLICGPLISQSHGEGALLSEIYCRILAAIGFYDRGDISLATEQLDAAIALALPDRLYAPLAEGRGELGVLMDERLAAVSKAAAQAVRALSKRLFSGWAVLQQKLRGLTFVVDLSPRERHVSKLVYKGLSNKEIAERMGLSVNTVKRYITGAFNKTGTSSRAQLAAYVALDGKPEP